jgi:hypothetical protein
MVGSAPWRITEAATACPKPVEFGDAGEYWSNEGWMTEVDFKPAPQPLQPAQAMIHPSGETGTAIEAAILPAFPTRSATCSLL